VKVIFESESGGEIQVGEIAEGGVDGVVMKDVIEMDRSVRGRDR
jgi:hypothetical protein